MEERINEVIDKLRPFLIYDGGNIEFVEYKDGICYIRFLGACANCELIDMTLKNGIEEHLIEEEVSDVSSFEEI